GEDGTHRIRAVEECHAEVRREAPLCEPLRGTLPRRECDASHSLLEEEPGLKLDDPAGEGVRSPPELRTIGKDPRAVGFEGREVQKVERIEDVHPQVEPGSLAEAYRLEADPLDEAEVDIEVLRTAEHVAPDPRWVVRVRRRIPVHGQVEVCATAA